MDQSKCRVFHFCEKLLTGQVSSTLAVPLLLSLLLYPYPIFLSIKDMKRVKKHYMEKRKMRFPNPHAKIPAKIP